MSVYFISETFHAGLTGLLLGASSQQAQATVPIKHLCNINPYVAAALSDWHRRCSLAASLPLQLASGIARGQGSGEPLTATSSFGMSGVNAHALVAAPSTSCAPSISTVSCLLHVNTQPWCTSMRQAGRSFGILGCTKGSKKGKTFLTM